MSGELIQLGDFDLGAWSPEQARLDRQTFLQGMALIRPALPKPLDRDTVQSFWLVVAEFEAVDYCPGVALALKRERYITPAALFAACQEERDARLAKARREREEAEERKAAAEHAEYLRERTARAEELRAEADSWSEPPQGLEELKRRALVLAEVKGHLTFVGMLRRAEWSGSVAAPVLTGEPLLGMYPERVEGLVQEAARCPVDVTVPDSEAQQPERASREAAKVVPIGASLLLKKPKALPPIETDDGWEKRRAELRRQAEELSQRERVGP